MRQTQVTGKKHFIIIVSEGVVGAQELANQIQAATGVDVPCNRSGPHPARRFPDGP